MKTRPMQRRGYKNATLHAKRDRKRAEAEARNDAWARHTPEEKLASLRTRRGGSNRQYNRIIAQPA